MAEEVKMEPVSGAEPPAPANPLKPTLKLPPKPGGTVSAMRPGLKLPPKPGATVSAMRPGLKLPPKPIIRKPGSTIAAAPIPKPIASAAPAAVPAPVTPSVPKPATVSVDQQGVAKLPTVEAKAVDRNVAANAPIVNPAPSPVEQLKAVTQKLKGITQAIPPQAVMHKTGIISDGAVTPEQKEAAKHKTARISLSEAIGVAPVKNENVPMKTIRIKRPIDIAGATKPLAPIAKPAAAPTAEAAPAAPAAEAAPAEAPAATTEASASITQRKTLKISRPGVVRPTGNKFGIKRSGATAATAAPAAAAAAAEGTAEPVAEIADIPDLAPIPNLPEAKEVSDAPAWLYMLSSAVQIAACAVMGALAWFLYQNVQTNFF